jgi:hypothetical protein
MVRLVSIVAALLAWITPALAQDGPRAARELNQMCLDDARALWGVSLCGPLLIADSATRAVWASAPDREGLLAAQGEGWVGVLPSGVGIANTSLDWAGERWIMIAGPLPADETERRVLLMHEAWHRAQAELGVSAQGGPNAHLATEGGRTLMRLELRALATALRSNGVGQRRATQDALLLRAARHAAFPAARADEAALDRNEGLASYTGVRLGAGANARQYALRTLDDFDRHDALDRAYAYASGPAYGLLLDEARPRWRSELGGAAPADVMAGLARPDAATPRNVAAASARYGGPQIAAEERARAEAQAARLASLRAGYAGARVELPLTNPRLEFDPNQVTPLDGLGTHYQTLTLRESWGELRASSGALISNDFRLALAAAPGPDGLSGPGWRLTLAPGWALAQSSATGPWRVAPASNANLPAPQQP